MFLILKLDTLLFNISSADRFVRQGQCPLQPSWAPFNETVEIFKGLYLRNFKEKQLTPYNISDRYEMEMRFHFKTPCGTMDYDPAAAIVGGADAPDKAWPWQVSVVNHPIYCGGVLIDANWVLTAAHCVKRVDPYTIRLGTRLKFDNIDVVVRTSRHIIVHEKYEANTRTNDIALIKMSSPVEFTDKVRQVCLPVYGQDFVNNDFCYITGFGQRRIGVPVDRLQQLRVHVVSNRECFYLWKIGPRVNIDWRIICVGRVGLRGGECRGDSGSPLSCNIRNRYYVSGIATFVHANCTHNFIPDVYLKVDEFIDWIFHTMNTYN
ncbi:Chymotrypsin-like elastase member 2A [Bulinus truncatus]|nr:Chymotrypsin-like elastase member 2A [Bulinus truncatus]